MERSLLYRIVAYLLLTVAAVTVLVPSVAGWFGKDEQLPAWMQKHLTRKILLGLDLQGGLHIVYKVDVDKAVGHKADRLATEIEEKLRRDRKVTRVNVTRAGNDEIVVTFTDPAEQGKTYPVTPAHMATLGLAVRHDGLVVSLDARYVGRRLLISDYTNIFPALPDYVVYDGRISYTWKQVSVFVSVYNFTNRVYFDSGGTNGRFNPAPERSWLVGFDLNL